MTNKKIPGSVTVRQLKTGDFLYYKSKHTNRKWIASGLKDSPGNRKVVWKIVEKLQLESVLPEENKSHQSTWTVKQCFDEFIEYCTKVKKLQRTTIENYQYAFQHIIKRDFIVDNGFHNGRRKIYELEDKIKEFIATTDLSPGSINIYLKGFGSFLTYLYQEGFINQINMNRYKQKVKRKEVVAYTQKQITDIITYFQDKNKPRLANWILFLSVTGLRMAESLNLKWSQIKFKEQYILVPKKNDWSVYDKFPLSEFLAAMLIKMKSQSEKIKDPEKRELVFGWKHQASKSYLNKEMKKALNHYGYKVEGSIFHPLRKAFATQIIESNNSYYAQSLMRHEDSQITKDHYWKQNLENLNKILSGYEEKLFTHLPNINPKDN